MMNIFELEQQMKERSEYIQKAVKVSGRTGLSLLYIMPGLVYAAGIFA